MLGFATCSVQFLLTSAGSVKKDEKHLSLRIEEKTLRKFDYVARYSDRSMNWMLIGMIKRQIAAFESEHGRIEIDDESHE